MYSLSFLPSVVVSYIYQDHEAHTFILASLITLCSGIILWFPFRRHQRELNVRDGYLVVTLFWVVLGITGAIPFMLTAHLDFTDSIFEAVSGFTTTGATTIVGLDNLPKSILYHRQQIQWLGGIGVVVLAVALLPILGAGGMQLYRAEASGISREEKLTPRITHTAKSLWMIYIGLTAACAVSYYLAGMNAFDAIAHAYSTLSTAGFSTHDASIGYFNSPAVEIVCIIFMLLGGINFAIHFVAWKKKSIITYLYDPECRAYLLLFVGATIFTTASLYSTHYFATPYESLRKAIFQVASILTSTGFGTDTYGNWPLHIPLALTMISYIGGCAGSTAGGIKVMRIMLLVKMGVRELYSMAHPRAIATVKLGNRRVPEDVVYAVWGYYVLYIVTALFLTLAMMAAGLDLESAYGSVTASLNLLGPGLGETAVNFASTTDTVKWLAVIGMLVGRLEVFTLLILFSYAFWRN